MITTGCRVKCSTSYKKMLVTPYGISSIFIIFGSKRVSGERLLVFCNHRICCQIEEEAAVLPYDPVHLFFESIISQNPMDYEERSDLEASAP